MAGATRLELAASCVTGKRSNQTELRPQRLSMCKGRINFLNHAYFVKTYLMTF